MLFHQLGPLGLVVQVVAMSVCKSVCLFVLNFFLGLSLALRSHDQFPQKKLWHQYPEKMLHLTIGPQIHDHIPSTHCGINTMKKCYI